MNAENILAILSYCGWTARRANGQIFVRIPGGCSPDLLDALRACKPEIEAALNQELYHKAVPEGAE